MLRSITDLEKLSQLMFGFFLNPAWRENRNAYEQAWLLAKCRVMKSIALIENRQVLESLYQLILSLSQLRYREKDGTLFPVFEQELRLIQVEIHNKFQIMKAPYQSRLFYFLKWLASQFPWRRRSIAGNFTLQDKIELLEENYRHVLQISAKDPFIYIYFIHDLYAFNETIALVLD